MIGIRDKKLYPLAVQDDGLHVFGGQPSHCGVTPIGSTVPVHKLLTLDLRDPAIPFSSSAFRYLPLYHPLKYGGGGPKMQYSVVSDDEIQILYMSDYEPDVPEGAYVKVDAFPEIRYAACAPIPNDADVYWFTITLGGTGTLDHESDPCQNSRCPNYRGEPDVDLIASVPPMPIPGHDDIWWEFEGAYMLFYFWFCRGSRTIITSNRCT